MAEIKFGSVTVTIPDDLQPPEKAGKMSPDEVASIPKAPKGLGLACEYAADAAEKAGDRFVMPKGVTPTTLRSSGGRSERVDSVLADMWVVIETLKQANLLFDADAWEQLRKMNDQVKAQGKHDAELLTIFEQLLKYMASKRPGTAAGTPPTPVGA